MGDSGARFVTGECKVGGKSCGMTGLHAVLRINSWPVYQVEVAPDATRSAGAAPIGAKEVASRLGDWQKRLVGGKLPVEFSVSIDGKSIVDVNGYASDVGMACTMGNVRSCITVLPDYARMDALNFAIYLPGLTGGRDIDSVIKAGIVTQPGAAKTLSEYIVTIAKRMMDEKVLNRSLDHASGDKAAQEAIRACHNVNKKVVKYFYELMGNSKGIDVFNIAALMQNGVSYLGPLCKCIITSLTRSNGSFLSAICSLANMFRLVYAPGKSKVGKLMPKSDLLEMSYERDYPVVQFNGSAANSGHFPLGCVYATLDHTGGDDIEVVKLVPGYKVMHSAGFKAKGFDGESAKRVLRISPPPWIPCEKAVIDTASATGKSVQSKGSRPGKAKDRIKKAFDKRKGMGIPWADLLKEWCYQEFCDQVLGPSFMAITSYKHELVCGARIDEDIGSGAVSCTDMQLTMGKGGAASARTTYQCTHAVYDSGVLSALK